MHRHSYSHLLIALLLLIVIATSGCNSSTTTSELKLEGPLIAPVASMPNLPPPSELAGLVDAERSASYFDEDLFHYGREYHQPLPNQHVAVDGNAARFSSSWAENSGLNGLAYSTFSFLAPDYDRDAELHFNWGIRPTAPEHIYFGFSNWAGDHWSWHKARDFSKLLVPSVDEYFDSEGLVFIVVAIAETGTASLDWINIGVPDFTAEMRVSAIQGLSPLDVSFDGSRTTCNIGNIASYEWDWEGDGVYDHNSGLDDTVEHTYNFASDFRPVMRVTSSYGMQQVDYKNIAVIYPWSTSWGKADHEEFYAIEGYGSDYLYCAGSTKSYGAGHNDALLVKYDTEGNVIWAKTWGGSGSDVIFDMVVSSSGYIYCVGSTWSFGEGNSDMFVQRWDPDGTLVWNMAYGDHFADNGRSITYRRDSFTDEIYVCGNVQGVGQGGMEGVILHFNESGVMSWDTYFGGSFEDTAGAITTSDHFTGPTRIHVAGTYSFVESIPMLVMLSFDTAGEIAQYYHFNDWEGHKECTDITGNSGSIATSMWISGWRNNGQGGRDAFLLEYPVTGSAVAKSFRLGDTDGFRATGIVQQASKLCLSGYVETGGPFFRGTLLSVNYAGTLLGSKALQCPPDDCRFNSLTTYFGGGVLPVGTASSSADATWQTISPTVYDSAGVWSSAAVTSGDANGTLTSLAGEGDTSDITSAVINSGGGGPDCILVATPAP